MPFFSPVNNFYSPFSLNSKYIHSKAVPVFALSKFMNLKKLNKIPSLLLGLIIFFFARIGIAGETETKIAETAGKVAIQATTVDALDKYANSKFKIEKTSENHNPVSKTLSIYNIGMNLKSFAEAENDKGKFYSALDATLGIVGLVGAVNPAVGMMLQVGLVLAKTTEQYLSVEHQKEMMKILKRIREHQEQYYSDLNLSNQSEQKFLADTIDRLNYSNDSILSTQKNIMAQCQSMGSASEYEQLEICLNNLRVLLLHYKQFNETALMLVSYSNSQFDINNILTKMSLSKNELTESISANKRKIEQFQDLLEKAETYIASSLAKTLLENISNETLLSTKEAFYTSCLNDMTQLQASKIQLTLLLTRPKNPHIQTDINRSRENLTYLTNVIEEKECFEVLDQDEDLQLFGTMLKARKTTWLKLRGGL